MPKSRPAMMKRERACSFWFCDNGGRTRSAVFAGLRLASLPSSPWGLPERGWVVHPSCLYPALPLNKPQPFALLAPLRAKGRLLNHLLVLSWQAPRKTVQMETGVILCLADPTFGELGSARHAKLQTATKVVGTKCGGVKHATPIFLSQTPKIVKISSLYTQNYIN